MKRVTNPFRSARVKPGTIPFIFRPGETLESVLSRLHDHRCGQILGPHGTGKSTLFAMIEDWLRRDNQTVHLFRLTVQERRLPFSVFQLFQFKRGDYLLIDGFEQIPTFQRWLLRCTTWLRGLVLIVTSHTETGLPTLYNTADSAELYQQIVSSFTTETSSNNPPSVVIQRLIAQHEGNMREVLFGLYDWFEESNQSNEPAT